LITRILGLLAIVALTLAAVGLYGMLAYAVTSRIPEIGVRLALGASSWSILSSIVREALVVVAVGAVAGLSVSLLVAQVLSKLLFGVTASDARVLSATVAVLFGVALLAVTRPAWRAARVNPLIALRYE
jgi:putative ABC transport system permease protein